MSKKEYKCHVLRDKDDVEKDLLFFVNEGERTLVFPVCYCGLRRIWPIMNKKILRKGKYIPIFITVDGDSMTIKLSAQARIKGLTNVQHYSE